MGYPSVLQEDGARALRGNVFEAFLGDLSVLQEGEARASPAKGIFWSLPR